MNEAPNETLFEYGTGSQPPVIPMPDIFEAEYVSVEKFDGQYGPSLKWKFKLVDHPNVTIDRITPRVYIPPTKGRKASAMVQLMNALEKKPGLTHEEVNAVYERIKSGTYKGRVKMLLMPKENGWPKVTEVFPVD